MQLMCTGLCRSSTASQLLPAHSCRWYLDVILEAQLADNGPVRCESATAGAGICKEGQCTCTILPSRYGRLPYAP